VRAAEVPRGFPIAQVLSEGLHHLEMAQLTQTREELRSWRQRSEDLAAELEQVRQNGAWLRDRLAASDAACSQLKAEAARWRYAEKAAAANGPRCIPLWYVLVAPHKTS